MRVNGVCVAPLSQNAIRDARMGSNLRKVTFAQTPRMSTYLLAFIVGEFDYVEGRDANGVLIRVYTPMTKSEQGEFALDMAIRTLPFYSDYFKVKYPLPKLDLIAIPDFSAGAMENWGLVTYRERLLLVDPKDTSLQSKQLVALVVGKPGGRAGGGAEVRWSNVEDGREVLWLPHTSAMFYGVRVHACMVHACVRACVRACAPVCLHHSCHPVWFLQATSWPTSGLVIW